MDERNGDSGQAQRWPEPQAERSDGPNGNFACAPAEERSAMGCARAPCASLTDSLRLSECSERSEQNELRNAAHGASTAGCPEQSGGTQPVGSPFLWFLSFGDAKERDSPAGATSRLPPSTKACCADGRASVRRPAFHRRTDRAIAAGRRSPAPLDRRSRRDRRAGAAPERRLRRSGRAREWWTVDAGLVAGAGFPALGR